MPDHVRNLGRFLYRSMFKDPAYSYLQSVAGLEEEASNPPAPCSDRPAQLYIEGFAKAHGLDAGMLKQFAQSASLEIANDALSMVRQYPDGMWYEGGPEGAIATFERVAANGISATIGDHRYTLATANYLEAALEATPPGNVE